MDSLNTKINEILQKNQETLKETVHIYADNMRNIALQRDIYTSSNSSNSSSSGEDFAKVIVSIAPFTGTFAPFVGGVGLIIAIISKIFGNSSRDDFNEQERRRAQEEQERVQKDNQEVDKIASELKVKYQDHFKKIIEKAYTQRILQTKDELERIQNNKKQFDQYIKELNNISNQVSQII